MEASLCTKPAPQEFFDNCHGKLFRLSVMIQPTIKLYIFLCTNVYFCPFTADIFPARGIFDSIDSMVGHLKIPFTLSRHSS